MLMNKLTCFVRKIRNCLAESYSDISCICLIFQEQLGKGRLVKEASEHRARCHRFPDEEIGAGQGKQRAGGCTAEGGVREKGCEGGERGREATTE